MFWLQSQLLNVLTPKSAVKTIRRTRHIFSTITISLAISMDICMQACMKWYSKFILCMYKEISKISRRRKVRFLSSVSVWREASLLERPSVAEVFVWIFFLHLPLFRKLWQTNHQTDQPTHRRTDGLKALWGSFTSNDRGDISRERAVNEGRWRLKRWHAHKKIWI